MMILKRNVFILGFLISLVLGCGQSSADALFVTLKKETRTPLLGRTHVFSRNHTKYNLYKNYLREHYQSRWTDRHLFHNRSLFNSTHPDLPNDYFSCLEESRHALWAGLDGFRSKPHLKTGNDLYNVHDPARKDTKYKDLCKNFFIMTEAGFNPRIIKEQKFSGAKRNAYMKRELNERVAWYKRQLQSPAAFRYKGKLVISTYHADMASPEQLKWYLGELRKEVGNTFLYVVEMGEFRHEHGEAFFENKGKARKDLVEKLKREIRAYLDVCDGVSMLQSISLARPDYTYYTEFYRDYVIPIMVSVLNEPAYKDKLFGFGSMSGYLNMLTGTNKKEKGTKYLRQSFETALSGNPDFVCLPEWHELNENNFIMPTVYNSLAHQRILRHYTQKLRKNETLPPLPNNHTDIPNLILSHPKAVRLGETLEFEILNVPDGTRTGNLDIELSLCDLKGHTLHTFGKQTLNTSKIKDVTLTLPSHHPALVNHTAIRPVLKVFEANGKTHTFADGLSHVHLRATWNWLFKMVKIPLRDLLPATTAKFELQTAPKAFENGTSILVKGHFACDEPIVSCEVLEDEEEVYAVGLEDQFPMQNNRTLVRLTWKHAIATKWLKGKISNKVKGALTVNNGKIIAVSRTTRDSEEKIPFSTHRFDMATTKYTSESGYYLVLEGGPKTTLHFDASLFGKPWKVNLADLKQYGLTKKVFDHHTVVKVEDFKRCPDTAFPLMKKSVAFETSLTPASANSLFHMRIITATGKIYRSKPVQPFAPSTTKKDIWIYDSQKDQGQRINVATSRVPHLSYAFSSHLGDAIATPAGRLFYGNLGGGFSYGLPFTRGNQMPKDATHTAPTWHTANSKTVLAFDGKDDYLWLPKGALPQSGFSLNFEVKPKENRKQILIHHHGYHDGPLSLWIEKDTTLSVNWKGKNPEGYGGKDYTLASKLKIPAGQWSTVGVHTNLNHLWLTVNGIASTQLKLGPTHLFFNRQVIIGGHQFGKKDDRAFFKGQLRGLSIAHGGPQ